jgi:hypothetical protein
VDKGEIDDDPEEFPNNSAVLKGLGEEANGSSTASSVSF